MMNTTKLTLSADKNLVLAAKRIAEAQGTSVSAMFMRFIQAMKITHPTDSSSLGPITRQAAGMIQIPPGVSDRQLIEEALREKYQ